MRFDQEEVKVVALGSAWVAAVTSLNFLRIFTDGGLQVSHMLTSLYTYFLMSKQTKYIDHKKNTPKATQKEYSVDIIILFKGFKYKVINFLPCNACFLNLLCVSSYGNFIENIHIELMTANEHS